MKIKVMYSTMIVKNLAESVAFYRDVLGFKEGYHVEAPIGQITFMQSEGGAAVELIESARIPAGLYSIGTDVDDLDEALETLRAAGYEPISPVMQISAGRQTFVLDPNGVRIGLLEHTEEHRRKYL